MPCKVELQDMPHNASRQEREIAFKKMFSLFKKRVAEAGILQDFKKHEFYESAGDKKRRKQKESAKQRVKQKLQENFPERRKAN
jgi:ribosomal protein S21